jgi:hypothetical protein
MRGNASRVGGSAERICGPLPIEEITTGDRVVSVDLETALPAPTFLDRPARRCRLAKHAAMAIVPAMMAACVPDVGPLPHPMAVVEVYNPRTGSWLPGTGGQLAVGDEVLHEGHLLHITASGAEDRGPAERRDLVLADGTWMGGDSALVPGAGDWVRVLGDGPTSGHWLLEDLQAGMSFAYAGRVFEADIVEGALLATPTERVLSRVVFPFERVAEGLIEAEVAYDDGTVEVVEATPDHPFRSGEQWLPLGELEIGASLHVDRGSAVLVSKTWRQGDVEVFNFGVKGTHNYVVASRSVLVHNACDIPGATGGRVNLASRQRTTHILDGDATGGGHGPGRGISGKSEFPSRWSDDDVMAYISDVVTDPNATHTQLTGRAGATTTRAGDPVRYSAEGTRDGIDIKVIYDSSGEIITGFPTNVPRNP